MPYSNALITGISSGFGEALTKTLLNRDCEVFGCSRRDRHPAGAIHRQIDLTDFGKLPGEMDTLCGDTKHFDLVVLNAGVLGEIRDLSETPLAQAREVMDINLWANKAVMDWLHQSGRTTNQVIMISSGASVLGNHGWSSYSLSKAALNMLARLYSHEFPDTHICALAPGIIDTAMMDYLCETADAERFPALQRLRDARGSSNMPGPGEAAEQVLEILPQLLERPSGDFIDIRELLDPEGYARLYGKSSAST